MDSQDIFHRYHIYRPIGPRGHNASLDIVVLAIRDRNSERVKIKIHYRHRKTGRLQYTGKGSGEQLTDTIKIYKKDFSNWKFVGHYHRVPMLNKDALDDSKTQSKYRELASALL